MSLLLVLLLKALVAAYCVPVGLRFGLAARIVRRQQEPAIAQTIQEQLPADRIWSRRTVDELVPARRGLTGIAAEEVHARHIGHGLRTEGRS